MRRTAEFARCEAFHHIIPISGGKDSGALALWLHREYPQVNFEMVFADTGSELPETYEFLDRLQQRTGRGVTKLLSRFGTLKDIMARWGSFLPSAHARYCTRKAKIEPFNEYVGDDLCVVYIGFTADEAERADKHVYPFVEAEIEDSFAVLREFDMEPPAYYKWRSRSGCTFCFYQRKAEWMNLLRVHPAAFEEAERIEAEKAAQQLAEGRKPYYWRKDRPLSLIRAAVEKEGSCLTPVAEADNFDVCAACSI